MKSFFSAIILFGAALTLVMSPDAVLAQEANPYAADAQNEVDTVNGDPTIADKNEAILTAMESMIGDNPDADAPKIAAAFVDALGIDHTSPLFAQIVYRASVLVPELGSQIGAAAAAAAGGSQAAQDAADVAVGQAVDDAANAAAATKQSGSSAGAVVGIASSSSVSPAQGQGASNPNLVATP